MTAKRAMLFVDAQNLIYGARNYETDEVANDGTGFDTSGFEYDVDKLTEALTDEYDLVRGYWFDSYPPGEREEKQGFFTFLETNGFRVDATELGGVEGAYKEKEADIRLASELIARGFTDAYDVAVVVSGDKDFVRAIRYVQDQGKEVAVAAFEGTMSGVMRRTADEYVHLDDIAEDIQRG